MPAFLVATNMVTADSLPPALQSHRAWAWPMFVVLAVLLLVIGVVQAVLPKGGGASGSAEDTAASHAASAGEATGSQLIGGNVSGALIAQGGGPSVYISGDDSKVVIGDPPRGVDAGRSPRVSPAAPSMLPPDIADFVDRDPQLARLRETLVPAASTESTFVPVAMVAGKPGAGKSALTIHLAHQLYDRFFDGQFYVDLRGAEREPLTPTTVLDVFLYAAGIPAEKVPGDLPGRQALYRTWLAGKRVLVVLDNAADELQVEPLLPNRPPAAALITSRRPLATVCSASPLILETLDAASAVDLLWAIARREPGVGDGPAAASVAERCGYLPLALRISGATLLARPFWSMQKLADALADEHTRLEQLSKEGLGRRHLDVRASVDLSYTTLEADIARSFRLLGGVLAVDFTKELATALAGLAPATVERHLDRLVDAQLLEVDQRDGRYRLHDLIRLFARERLEAAERLDELAAARARAIDWYVELAEATYQLLHPHRPISSDAASSAVDQAAALARLDAERLNLLPVVSAAVASGLGGHACRLAVALGGYFRMRSAWDDWHRVGQLGLEAAQQSGDERARANALHSLAGLYELTDELTVATDYCQSSLALSTRLGDGLAEFEALRILGVIRTKQGRLDDATACFERGLRISRELSYGWGEGAALHHLGRIQRRQGRLDEAVASSRQSLAVSRRLRNRWGEAANLNDLGLALRDRGELERAIACFKQSRTIYQELADRWGEATASHHLGLALRDQGELEQATAYLQHSRGIYGELGDRRGLERVLRSLGEGSSIAADHPEPG